MYRVTANVRYLDGALKGIDITDGSSVTYPTGVLAFRAAKWINTTRAEGKPILATGTRNSFVYTSNAIVKRIACAIVVGGAS